MSHVLLISNNEVIRSELRKITAVVNVELCETINPTFEQVQNAHRILIDHDVTSEALNVLKRHGSVLQQNEVCLILGSSPNQNTWKIAQDFGAEHVALLPESRQWLLEYLKAPVKQHAEIIAISSVVGGVGGSTLAGYLGTLWAKQNERVVVIDCDTDSVGLDVTFGLEQEQGLRWSDGISTEGKPNGEALFNNLLGAHNVKLLANDRLNQEVLLDKLPDFITALGNFCDVVLLDIPLRVCEPLRQMSLQEMTQVLVMPNTLRACAVAHATMQATEATNQVLAVREIPGSTLTPLAIAQSLDKPLWATLPTDHKIVELTEQGLLLSGVGPGKYNRAVSNLLVQLSGEQHARHIA